MANAYVNDFTNTVQLYIQDIKEFNPLSKEEERELILKAQADDKSATDRLLQHNLKFVIDTARKFTGCGASMGDLISEGNLGLIRAIKKFDTTQDVRFISYAVWWIKHSMYSFLKNEQTRKKREYYEEECLNTIYSSASDSDDGYDEIISQRETIKDDSFEEQTTRDNRELIRTLITCLTKEEQVIVEKRYGLNSTKEYSLQEIGDEMNLTKERVRQKLVRALRKLKTKVLLNEEFFC